MKKILKNTSLLYALLMFAGYYDYYTYYINFDIKISQYLSTSELLFSFLNLSVAILWLVGLYIYIYSYRLTMIIKRENNEIINIDMYFNNLLKKLHNKYLESDSKFFNISYISLYAVILISSFIIMTSLILYIFSFSLLSFKFQIIPFELIVLWAIISTLIIFSYLKDVPKKKMNIIPFLKGLVTILIFFGVIRIHNEQIYMKMKNDKIYSQTRNYHSVIQNIEFRYDDRVISTDTDTIFIGETKDYVFLKVDSDNLIFKSNKIDMIKYKHK